MKWASALSRPASQERELEPVLRDCARKIRDRLEESKANLVLCFIAPHFLAEYGEVPRLARLEFPDATIIGCSAGGLIGEGIEIEGAPAVAMCAAVLPDVKITPFHLGDDELPDLDAPQAAWESAIKVKNESHPSFVLLPDPFTFRIDVLAQGLDFAFPDSVKVGGLASGGHQPGVNALFLDDGMHSQGCVGVALSGNLVLDTIVAQGCKPVGRPLRVTRAERNFLIELDGEPAVHVLHEILSDMSEKEREMAKNALFLGVVTDEFKEEFAPGDFLIRNILGLEPNSGALLVGEILRTSQTVQFHVRDAGTSAEDLRALLKSYRDRQVSGATGALLFSCLGRGKSLYGVANHDSLCFQEYFGPIPLAGFFCNGEIGPVGGTTFLHGYTSSFGIFRPR